MSDTRPLVSLRDPRPADDGIGVRFPPGLGLIPPRDFSTRRIKPRTATEWTG
jgi:hypothetical protein